MSFLRAAEQHCPVGDYLRFELVCRVPCDSEDAAAVARYGSIFAPIFVGLSTGNANPRSPIRNVPGPLTMGCIVTPAGAVAWNPYNHRPSLLRNGRGLEVVVTSRGAARCGGYETA
jgi:hypothetical protein